MTDQVVAELEERFCFLADPAVEWVPNSPKEGCQSCLLFDYGPYRGSRFSVDTERWLTEFVLDYSGMSVLHFNDSRTSKAQVLWMLEEAIAQASWEANGG